MIKLLKVLLVDDEKFILKRLAETIDWNSLGMEVVAQATDGNIALELYNKHRPDIIITDIYMPKMTGLELAQKVRRLSAECEFIILTAYPNFEYAKEAIDYFVASYQLKPIKNSVLIDLLVSLKSKIEQKRTCLRNASNLSSPIAKTEQAFPTLSEEQITAVINALKTKDNTSIQKSVNTFFTEFEISKAPIKHIINEISALIYMIEKKLVQSTVLMNSIFLRQLNPSKELSNMTEITDIKIWLKTFFEQLLNSQTFYAYINSRPIVQRTILYIVQHYPERITTNTVSELFSVSSEHLTRLFKADVGKTFVKYLVEYRISIAIFLLKNTNYKIYEISNLVGYPNVIYFNKIFKTITGAKPSHYQKSRETNYMKSSENSKKIEEYLPNPM
jgi:two-component system response regulator YesN